MMSAAFVQLALRQLSCSQKELALKLGVSPTQITKWKNDEHMSIDMEQKFRKLTRIGDRDPQFVLWAGSIESAEKWELLIRFIADIAHDAAETGYITYPLTTESEILYWHTFHTLNQMGVAIPSPFPQELDIDYDDASDEEWEMIISENPISSLIYSIFTSLNDVYGFFAAYIHDSIYSEHMDEFDPFGPDIESCLMELAACKVEIASELAPQFGEFKRQTLKNYTRWLTKLKEKSFHLGTPLKAELLDLVYNSVDELSHKAEAESLGFNSSRLHPDIYMNQLLTGMKAIHQVLPAIMKKLGIEDEFELDVSELRNG
jgi:transcriptional regulator with XRE-family HTH domain